MADGLRLWKRDKRPKQGRVLAGEGSALEQVLTASGRTPRPMHVTPATQDERKVLQEVWANYQRFAQELNTSPLQVAGMAAWASAVLQCQNDRWMVAHLAPVLALGGQPVEAVISRAGFILAAIFAEPGSTTTEDDA